jgi:hypothetical protein
MRLRYQLRVVTFYLVLLLGSFSGVSMLPKDIDESLHAHIQAKVEKSTRDSDEDDENGELKQLQER